jgi:hypothetical protein
MIETPGVIFDRGSHQGINGLLIEIILAKL